MQAMVKPHAGSAKRSNRYFMEKNKDVGNDFLKGKSSGGKQEFRVTRVSQWLSCMGGQFLTGDAKYIFPCWCL